MLYQHRGTTARLRSRRLLRFPGKPHLPRHQYLRSQPNWVEPNRHKRAQHYLHHQRFHRTGRNIRQLNWIHVLSQHQRRRDRTATWAQPSTETGTSILRPDRQLRLQRRATSVERETCGGNHRRSRFHLQRMASMTNLNGRRIEGPGNEGIRCAQTCLQIQQLSLEKVASRTRNLTSGRGKQKKYLRTFLEAWTSSQHRTS